MGGNMWEKIETFLFDIMGLLIPGVVFLVGLIFTSLFLISNDFFLDIQDGSKKIVFIGILLKSTKEISKHFWLLVVFFLFNAYLTGHIIKVFSKWYYDFFELIFDKFLNKIYIYFKKFIFSRFTAFIVYLKRTSLFNTLNLALKSNTKKFLIKIKSILEFIGDFLKGIFTYRAQNYEKDNKKLFDESLKIINNRFNTEFPEKWYSIYKLSKIINYHENLKSMNDTFLAKYNFYRSLSFISFLQIVLLIILYFNQSVLNVYSTPLIITFLIINFIFWYTFHEKYKRYHKLCGNDTLVSIYYHLKKTEETSN